ncbi:MAG: SpoIIE family protein phosphatase [bacterium]|nr:SpoIIE family protein phosphatase [bacterium]
MEQLITSPSAQLTIGTSQGLVKTVNEDCIEFRLDGNQTVVCLCDGHWGDTAAKLVCRTIANNFPSSRRKALHLLNHIELQLLGEFGKEPPNPEIDQPPETSLVAVRFDSSSRKLTVICYGDCRILISNHGQIRFHTLPQATWLGVFSRLGLRGRIPVKRGLTFNTLALQSNDSVWMFTDGVDECIYEKPTLSHGWVVKHNISEIFAQIEKQGAQDNASLVILKC